MDEGHYLGGFTLPRLFTVIYILLLSTTAALIQSCTPHLRDGAGANAVAAQLESRRKACPSLSTFRESNVSYLYQPRMKLAWSSMAIQSQPYGLIMGLRGPSLAIPTSIEASVVSTRVRFFAVFKPM